MIRETVVTTLSPDGVPHVAPMGATPTEEGWLLQPFRPSTTLDNFLATRCGPASDRRLRAAVLRIRDRELAA
ncbi:DUF447 domain-containing protein [Hansschlegelia beijingensis]